MKYIKEKILFPKYEWDLLNKQVREDLYLLITEIPETTVDYVDGSIKVVSELPFELNFCGEYNKVRNKVQPVPKVFNNHKHIDSFYPQSYFELRKRRRILYYYYPSDYIEFIKAITDCLTNSTMVYFDSFEANCNLKELLAKI